MTATNSEGTKIGVSWHENRSDSNGRTQHVPLSSEQFASKARATTVREIMVVDKVDCTIGCCRHKLPAWRDLVKNTVCSFEEYEGVIVNCDRA